MKNQITSKIVKFAFAFMFVLLASSCSDDNETLDAAALAKDQINSEISAKGGKIVATAIYGAFNYSDTTVCLGDDLTVSFDNLWGDASDCGETQIQYSLDGGATWNQLDKGTVTDGVFSKTFTPEEGTYSFRADFVGNAGGCKDGFDNLKSQDNTVLAVVVVAPCYSCNESFSYVPIGGDSDSYTFSYTPAEDLEGATVIFTFAQGASVITTGSWDNKGVTEQMVINLEACKTYFWTVTLTPNCSGNQQKSNVWTDFKVVNNDGDLTNDSKKNISESTPNIEISCN